MAEETEERLREAIRHALNGEAVLFLGAGSSRGAHGPKGDRLPTGQELSDQLADDFGLSPGYELGDMAEFIIQKHSETALINALRRYLKVVDPGNDLEVLASLQWSRIWTTNYDDAIQQALRSNGTSHYTITTAADAINARGNKLLVVHVNGSLAKLRQSITKDFVLTSASYATQAFVDTVWSTVLRNDLQSTKAVIFVGYSLYDIDVARILFNPGLVTKKTHFIDHTDLDQILEAKLTRFGSVHRIGVEGLAKLVVEERATWTRPTLIEEYASWSRVEPRHLVREASDADVFDLVLKGYVDEGLLLAQCDTPDEASYTVAREYERDCLAHLGQPNAIALLIGGFANGKTVSMKSIGLQLIASGRDVFTLGRPTHSSAVELRRMCKRDRDFIVVIENYSRNLGLIEDFCRYAPANCALLLSEKSEIHELRAPALLEKTGNWDLGIFDLDRMENVEIDRMSRLLDLRGLWGERAGLSEQQRVNYLRHECGRQLHAVMLEVINAPHVKKRLSEIVEHFESVEDGMRMLIVLCFLQAIGEEPRVGVASDLLGLAYKAYQRLSDDDIVRQILNIQSGVALFRSPVIARAVLSGVNVATTVTDVIVGCVKEAHFEATVDPYLKRIAREFTRFANLERVLPAQGKGVALQNFYERLKSVPSIRRDPLFWLQYAMARLSLGELEVARRYFEQSYSIANRSNFDTYQIDNHYCRLLLREAEETGNAHTAYTKLDDTIEILKRQVQRESRHYPYRSAWNVVGVVNRHQVDWTKAQRRSVLAGVRYLMDAARHLDDRTARSVAVVGALERLRDVEKSLDVSDA